MEAKIVIVLALVAVGHSSVLPVTKVDNDYTSFSYDVADPNTGDYKSQVETRVGGNVQGQYSLLESDGTKRIVDYAADDINGFNAIVRKNPAIIGAPVLSGSIVKSAPVISAAPFISGYAPGIIAAPTLAASSLIQPIVAARTVVPQPQAFISSPSVFASPGFDSTRTYGAPALVAGPASSYITATKYTEPAVIAASAPVVTAPYAGSALNYATPFVGARALLAPGIGSNLAFTGATSYVTSYSSPLKY